MSEKMEKIFKKYEDMTLKNFDRYENGEEFDTDTVQVLNDSIRILHHIAQLRGYVPGKGLK